MLGVLAKYIFGGMMGDAPETTAPELQYHTREVNDWLLVDMPDQAIDDEDMDSESDDDDILTALPLLMAEEVIVQPVQILQSYEDGKDFSVCDNSYDKVQRRFVDKIRSVPSAVQHHSGDKTQGNFVDNVEALSIEAEDNFPDKIQDISANVQEKPVPMIQKKTYAQVCYASVKVQKNSDDRAQDVFDDRKKSLLSEVQNSFDGEKKSNSVAKIEAVSVKENSIDRIHNNIVEVQGNIHGEDQKIFDDKVLREDVNGKIHPLYPEVQDNSDDKVRRYFVDKVEREIVSVEGEDQEDYNDRIDDDFCAELGRLYEEYARDEVQESCNRIQNNLNCSQGEFYLENYNPVPVSYSCVQRRLYSEVVQMCEKNQNSIEPPVKNMFGVELGKNNDRYVRIFGDETQESSDDEMNETSDDEMNENSNDETSDAEVEEKSNGGIRGKSHDTVIRLSSDEESEEYSEDENSDIFVDFYKRFYLIPSKRFYRNRERRINEQKEVGHTLGKLMDKLLNHNVGCIPHTEYEHAVDFSVVPQCWYAYQTWHDSGLHALLVRDDMTCEPSGRCPHYKFFLCKNTIRKKFKSRPLPVEDEPPSPSPTDPSLITNSAEILQNLINQKSTILPTKTAVVLEHIKELKPVQQAIQFENRKYLTRSQLNRQNRNYMYQSSVKTNRRRNLQRNHSGANNNRKC